MKIVIFTLGCKVNQYESDGLAFMLEKMGHEVSTKLEVADVYILNTCAVTNEAEKKSRQMLAKFKELNPNAKIMVCGCASQKNASQFLNLGANFVSGTANKMVLSNLEKIGCELEELPTTYNEYFVTKPTKTFHKNTKKITIYLLLLF